MSEVISGGTEAGSRARRCPACADAVGEGRGQKNGFELDSCRSCGTLYARRAGSLDYDCYYHDDNLSVPEFVDRWFDETFATFEPYRKTNRLLDVGCGAGSLLHAARRAGWDAEGVEVSRPAAEHVRAQGFEVFCGELKEARYPEGRFDVVTASEILEHLDDPQSLLEEAARVLRPGGLFWATTPHGRGLSARVLGLKWSTVSPPEHLQLFSLAGVRRMLKRAGFRRAGVTSRGVNPFEIWHALRRPSNGATSNTTNAAGATSEAGGGTVESAPAQQTASAGEGFQRVATGYRLNEALLKNSATRAVKAAVNAALGATRLGDSIKIRAEK